MSDTPHLVSIVMPAYNAEKYIEEAIRSVLMQTYMHWELIVIDDGSTDNTRSIIDTFKDKRIHVISQENAGVSVARNRGLDIANGKYITFLDADDVLPKESLETRVYFLDNHQVDMVHGGVSVRDSTLQIQQKIYFPFMDIGLFKKILHLNNKLFFNPCYMIKRESIEQIRFKDGMSHCEDILFLLELVSKKLTYKSVDATVYIYRVSKVSAMNNMSGLIQGYDDLLGSITKIQQVSYIDTIIMRFKIMRVMLSWYMRSGQIAQFLTVFKVFYR